ncbi:MAG: tetraacyldisaccharide 4'-kinase [Bdellovibrionota bacterium]
MSAPALFKEAVSEAWSMGSALARGLAHRGLLRTTALPCRVISVGNLQAGGAGKTPLVAQIAREAIERSFRVCILTRGYGGQWEKSGGLIAPDAREVDPVQSGDEAALLHLLVPTAWIAIGADRVRQFQRAQSTSATGFDLVILDDGFQHWKIRKDIEIVAVTSSSRSQRIYRDSNSALRSANLVVWTKGELRPDSGGRPFVRVRLELERDRNAAKGIWLVTGVGDSQGVLASAREASYQVERHFEFADHAQYDATRIREILEQAAQAGCRVALTGKDWVKWKSLGVAPESVTVLEPRVQFLEGRDVWDSALWQGRSSTSEVRLT